MGMINPDWNNLGRRWSTDIIIVAIATLVHNILVIPIFLERQRHEAEEYSLQKVQNVEDQNCIPKSLESFITNCLIMALGTIVVLNLTYLNK